MLQTNRNFYRYHDDDDDDDDGDDDDGDESRILLPTFNLTRTAQSIKIDWIENMLETMMGICLKIYNN